MSETNFSALDSNSAAQSIDIFKPAGGSYRQAIVMADPTTSANIVPVQTTDPISNSLGMVVRDVNTSAIVAQLKTTIAVSLDPGHTLGSVSGIGSSVAIYFDRATPSVNVSQYGGNTVLTPTSGIPVVNTSSTMSIFSVSGSASGVSTLGNTIISPSASYNFKIFAFSIQTTGIVSIAAKFTNGAGSATEFFRPLVTAAATTSSPVGANLAVQPPGYLFATGTNTTLSLVLDSATLVHYSVSFIKESA